MDNNLYPLKFKPIIKDKIWGGTRLKSVLNKKEVRTDSAGESWELSAVQGDVSVVKDGFLKDNNIEELIEVYMGDLVGDKIYDRFGVEFPLLIKFIDANDWLSIQVHPDDEMAKRRHNSYGKTEMWYVIDANEKSELITGFSKELNKKQYVDSLEAGNIRDILNYEKASSGDVFFMPAGRIHATGPSILFAEIQQTSDITYRIFDWDRVDDDGKSRDLHTDLALDAIDFEQHDSYRTSYSSNKNDSSEVVSCEYFTTNIIDIDDQLERDYVNIDSFVIYMGLEGEVDVFYDENSDPIVLAKGETLLVPAIFEVCTIVPKSGAAKLLEIYIPD